MNFLIHNHKALVATALITLAVIAPETVGQTDEPPLPSGLFTQQDESTPQLPMGLPAENTEKDTVDLPDLPSGLDEPIETDKKTIAPEPEVNWLNVLRDMGFSGFVETRIGSRTQPDRNQDDLSIAEARLRLAWQKHIKSVTLKISGDLVYDYLTSNHDHINPVTGSGFIDLREAWAGFSPAPFMDIKFGRQSLTWGTGDLLFVNDMFAKDWQSFFIGRDLEYLKAPSDALRTSLYTKIANAEIVYMPRFVPSRGITGRRLSYFNPMTNTIAGQNAKIDTDRPSKWFVSDQWAARLYKRIGSYEFAAYNYIGYWSTPQGTNLSTMRSRYPRLNSYGLSVRGPVTGGIANIEAAYYHSRQDPSGDDPFTRNSEIRLLGGYEFDLPSVASDLTLAFQYYIEHMLDYGKYRDTLAPQSHATDKFRHVMTARLTKLAMNQNLNISFFGYFSPTDQDTYIRPQLSYKISDHITWSLGANIFAGKHNHTFFAQFKKNTNIYTTLRIH